MNKLNLLYLPFVLTVLISCKNDKKEQEKLNTTLDKIETVESEINKTSKELNIKSKEVETALSDLDNI